MNGVKHRQNGPENACDPRKSDQLEVEKEKDNSGDGGHVFNNLVKLVMCTVGGVVFGFAAEKGRGN